MKQNEDQEIQKPVVGKALAIASGFSFYVLCMIFPMVGPSGSREPHAAANRTTFIGILLLTLALGAASIYVALQHRRQAGGALPRFPIALCAVCLLILSIVLLNGFAI